MKYNIYIIGGVITANFFVALLYSSQQLFRKAGFSKPETDALLETLIRTTLHNFKQEGAKKTLTGPLQRGDALTIRYHLDILRTQWPDLADLYIAFSRFIIHNLVDLKQDKLDKIIKLLHP